ncbi:TPA: DUF4888 domain-containing protein [Staphylococcus aureus]|nr:DUF4888 domain-containing protein [Staphylococcus aureus]
MNKKLLTKTLIASALVLTTVGSGFHSSSNYNGINNVAKAEQTTDNALWKNVRDALKDANIIDKTDNENVKVTYKIENGGENTIEGTANLENISTSNNPKINPQNVTKINITRKNSNYPNIDANNTWKKLTEKLKEKNIVNNGDNVSILSTDPKDETVFGKVGEDRSNVSNRYINPKDINEIQITKK